MSDNLDAVISTNPYRCGTCKSWQEAGRLVVRRINLRPDHPLEVESVDTLECAECLETANREAKAGHERGISRESLRLSRRSVMPKLRLIHEHEPVIGWRQIRHGRLHRAPRTHTEERAERDEATRPSEEEYEQARRGWLEMSREQERDS